MNTLVQSPSSRRVSQKQLRTFLDRKVAEYNQPSFIAADPISVPHRFTKKQDIEIAALFAAIFSWGNRTTIIRKSEELMERMDRAPHQFILNHGEKDLRGLLDFKHRTFNATDLLYFVAFLQHHYRQHDSLEDAFLSPQKKSIQTSEVENRTYRVGHSLTAFRDYFFSLEDAPPRTFKHISCPEKNSGCKRLNMFLRWMVRQDNNGVDFGIWKRIPANRLICPLDLHVARVARRFGLLTRESSDWQAALELTSNLQLLDPADPVKYDFALFGLGVMERF